MGDFVRIKIGAQIEFPLIVAVDVVPGIVIQVAESGAAPPGSWFCHAGAHSARIRFVGQGTQFRHSRWSVGTITGYLYKQLVSCCFSQLFLLWRID